MSLPFRSLKNAIYLQQNKKRTSFLRCALLNLIFCEPAKLKSLPFSGATFSSKLLLQGHCT